MAMNYTTLVASSATSGSIANWINKATAQAAADEILVEAQSWIYRRLRHWKMISAPTTGSLTINQDYLTSPTDMLEPIVLVTTGQYFQEIQQRTMQEVIGNWSFTGTGTNRTPQQPRMFYFDETTMRFDSPPNIAYTYALLYFKQPADLGSGNQTNFLTVTYPRLVRAACTAAACEWAKDSGQGNFDRTYWDQIAQDEIEKAQAESDRARRGTIAGAILVGGGGLSNNFPAYVSSW